jgi:hypothetical protein
LIRVIPDAVMVWNDVQADEARRLHRIPEDRIVVTGAQSLDRWFDRARPDDVSTFRRTLGIDERRRVLLWVGSSRNMAPGDSEVRFVNRWLAAVRASANPDLRDAFVIVRPHPGNVEPWTADALTEPHTAIFPPSYPAGIMLTDSEVEAFWHSLLASSAVIGINTTAMIEAAIVGRPVFSVRDPTFAHSQQQTLHFDYLTSAQGWLHVGGKHSLRARRAARTGSGREGVRPSRSRPLRRTVRTSPRHEDARYDSRL